MHTESTNGQEGIIHILCFISPDFIVIFHGLSSFLHPNKKWRWTEAALPVSSQISAGRALTPPVLSGGALKTMFAVCLVTKDESYTNGNMHVI